MHLVRKYTKYSEKLNLYPPFFLPISFAHVGVYQMVRNVTFLENVCVRIKWIIMFIPLLQTKVITQIFTHAENFRNTGETLTKTLTKLLHNICINTTVWLNS